MAECGESPYEMIELGALHDLQSGQLLRAELGAIDRAANTAEITLLDVCPAMSGISLSDVPFFYHCQFSTGTLEDLEFGHSAFFSGDVVYVLYVPESGNVPERFYIVGHVDIRGTKQCVSDFVVIEATIPGSTTTYVTMFDVQKLSVVDPQTFPPVDSGSPAPPDQFPCQLTQGVASWISYNFSTSEWGATVNLLVKMQLYGKGNKVTTIITDDSNSPTADPHTENKEWTVTFTGDYGFQGTYSTDYSDSNLLQGQIRLAGGGDLIIFYRHSVFSSEYSGIETREANSSGWNMYDTEEEKSALMPILSSLNSSATSNSYGSNPTSDWFSQGCYKSYSETDHSVEFISKIKYPYTETETILQNLSSSYHGECTRNGGEYLSYSGVSGDIVHSDLTYDIFRDVAGGSNPLSQGSPAVTIISNGATIFAPETLINATAVGKFGVYSVLYFRTSYRYSSAAAGQLAESVGMGGVYLYRSGIHCTGYTEEAKDSTFAVATMFDDIPDFVGGQTVPVEDCMKHVNADVSIALGEASEELEQYINDTTNGYYHYPYYVKVYNRKEV